MADTPSSAGQGTLEITTSLGGLLTLRAHPAFSFLAPSASLKVTSITHAVIAVPSWGRACFTVPCEFFFRPI
jgi:hypothetical protein